MNLESASADPTSNVQHRIMYSVNLKEGFASLLRRTRGLGRPGASLPFETCLWVDYRSLVHLFSVIRLFLNPKSAAPSIFNVRCSTFKAYSPPLEDLLFRPGGVSYERTEIRCQMLRTGRSINLSNSDFCRPYLFNDTRRETKNDNFPKIEAQTAYE